MAACEPEGTAVFEADSSADMALSTEPFGGLGVSDDIVESWVGLRTGNWGGLAVEAVAIPT